MMKNSPTALIVCSFAAPVEKGHFHFTSAQLTPFKTLQVRKHNTLTPQTSALRNLASPPPPPPPGMNTNTPPCAAEEISSGIMRGDLRRGGGGVLVVI